MCGLDVPTSIYMIMSSLALLLMNPSSICLNRTVACAYTSLRQQLEVLQNYVTNFHKVRRLHLLVVDLWRPWKYNTARTREITDQLWLIRDCENTYRVSPFRPDGPEPRWGAVDLHIAMLWMALSFRGSEFPCYLVWPQRDGRSYVLLDTATADTLVLDQKSFFRPLGMQHFYDSFALVSQICVPWRPNRAAPETKDFLTTKTRVANHTLFPSTAEKANMPTSTIPHWHWWSRGEDV